MSEPFRYDVFLSHSAKGKAGGAAAGGAIAEGRAEGVVREWVLKPGDGMPAKIQIVNDIT